MAERHYDRGNLYDNQSAEHFMEEVSPDNAFLNPGRDFYGSDEEYFVALISAEFDGPRRVRPDPFGDTIELYEAPGVVVALGDEVEVYSLDPASNQVNQVFDRMLTDRSSGVRKVEELDLDQGVEEEVERLFDMV